MLIVSVPRVAFVADTALLNAALAHDLSQVACVSEHAPRKAAACGTCPRRQREYEFCHQTCFHALAYMQNLTLLYLSDNPCAQQQDYRATVIELLPQLRKLDNIDVAQTQQTPYLQEFATPEQSPAQPDKPRASQQGASSRQSSSNGEDQRRKLPDHFLSAQRKSMTRSGALDSAYTSFGRSRGSSVQASEPSLNTYANRRSKEGQAPSSQSDLALTQTLSDSVFDKAAKVCEQQAARGAATLDVDASNLQAAGQKRCESFVLKAALAVVDDMVQRNAVDELQALQQHCASAISMAQHQADM